MFDAIHGFLSWSVYGIPAFLFLITVVVFFHELGHFSVARLFGVRVETFSIGFGRALYSWKDKKGTLWKISWVPLGGFVKFFGDADGASTPDREAAARMSDADRSVAFPFKPLWQRALIVVAGPVANFILAFVILTVFFMAIGRVLTPANVTDVAPHSAAQAAGIRAGDLIVSIDGEAISGYEEIQQIISVSAGIRLPIVVSRSGHLLTLYVTPRETEITDPFKNKIKIGQLGILNRSNSNARSTWAHRRGGCRDLRGPRHYCSHVSGPRADFQGKFEPTVWSSWHCQTFRPGRFRQLSCANPTGSSTFGKHWAGQPFSHSAARRGPSSVLCMRRCFGAAAR